MGARMKHIEQIARRIISIRGQRVILDEDLAALYGVETRRLNEQVRRNRSRFPADFVFVLEKEEIANLKSQIATSSWGGRRKPPSAFTEHGAVMAATVLSSPRAIEVSLYVVRAFIQLRDALHAHKEIARRLNELERKVGSQDRTIVQILEAIRQLTATPDPKRRKIGFL